VIKPIVPIALNLLALVHWNLHHVQILNFFFAAVLIRRSLDSSRLTQGPTMHLQTLESFHKAHRSPYFQCNISQYAHVLGLKLPEIRQVWAWFWVSSWNWLHISEPIPSIESLHKKQGRENEQSNLLSFAWLNRKNILIRIAWTSTCRSKCQRLSFTPHNQNFDEVILL
jgi:hypothetical protein